MLNLSLASILKLISNVELFYYLSYEGLQRKADFY